MKIPFIIFFCFFSAYSFAQSARNKKPKPQRINVSKPIATEPKKQAYVVVTSDEKVYSADEWENQWTKFIEDQSRQIGMKVLNADTTRRVYRVMLLFSVKEDGEISNLSVSCSPRNELIEKECSVMATNAPKKKLPSGKFVKMNIQQPVDIKVR